MTPYCSVTKLVKYVSNEYILNFVINMQTIFKHKQFTKTINIVLYYIVYLH